MIVPGWVLADLLLQAPVTAYAAQEQAGTAESTTVRPSLPAGSNVSPAAGEAEDACSLTLRARLLQRPDFSCPGCQLASFHKHRIP